MHPAEKKINTGSPFYSDGSSLRLGPGLARHLEGLLELEFWRLDPSIGWVKPQAQALGLRLGLGSSSEFGGSTHHYYLGTDMMSALRREILDISLLTNYQINYYQK